jgi:membrane associated rhomboid family serine protease
MPDQSEKRKLYKSLVAPAILLLLIWGIKAYELIFHADFSDYGILPQTLTGLKGIFFAPLIHADISHAFANSVPLLVLMAALYYYYGKMANGILALSWLITGFWVWVFAKNTGYHIGASGVVYALAAFHFTSGLLRKDPKMMAFSLLVVFLYGGLIWGIYPDFFPEKNISWQSHLLGSVAGVILAFFYRSDGPQRKEYEWEDEDEDDFTENDESRGDYDQNEPEKTAGKEPTVIYHLRNKNNDEN